MEENFQEEKENILIFGAGEAGKAAFNRLKKTVNIIGFLDNDKAKVGNLLFKKRYILPQNSASCPMTG